MIRPSSKVAKPAKAPLSVSNLLRRLCSEKKFFWSLIVRVGSAAVLVISSIVLARALGVEAFGTYSFVLAIVAVLQLPATAGAYTLVMRETAAGIARSDFAGVRGLWQWSSRFVGKLSMSVVVFALIALLLIDHKIDPDKRNALLIAVLTVPVVALLRLYSARLRGLGMIVLSQVPEQLLKPGVFMLLVITCAALLGQVSSPMAVGLYLIASVFGLGMLALLFRRASPVDISRSPANTNAVRSWRSALVPLTLLSGLQIVNSQAGLVILGSTGNVAGVAELKLATAVTIAGTFASQVVSFVLGPDFAKARATGSVSAMTSLARRAVGLSLLTSLPVLATLAIFATPILRIAYGQEYGGAAGAVIILSVAYMFMTLFGACSMILTMTGNERVAVVGHVIGLSVNLTLLFALVPSMGSIGAAISISAGMLLAQTFMLVSVLRVAGFDPSALGLVRHLLARQGL